MFQFEPFDGQFVVGLDARADPTSVAPDGSISDELEGLRGTLERFGARLVPLFGARQGPLRDLELQAQRLDLSRFYFLVGADGTSAEMYVRRLREHGEIDALRDALLEYRGVIEFAYFRPVAVPANAVIPDTTPDFSPLQTYLGPAPYGIDAVYARNWGPGGFGYGVHVVDVERAWCLTHEDLVLGAPVNVLSSGDPGDRNHGTAVAGMLAGDVDTKGVVGICPAAQFDAVAVANDAWAAARRDPDRGGTAARGRRALG